jgi:hypothetical protein
MYQESCMQQMPHTGLGLVVLVELACRLVGAAAERSIVLKGPRVSQAEIYDRASRLPAAVRPLCSTA